MSFKGLSFIYILIFFFLKSPEISPDALDDGWGGGSMRNGSDKGLRWMDVGEEEPAVSKKQRGGGGLCHEGAVCVCVCVMEIDMQTHCGITDVILGG